MIMQTLSKISTKKDQSKEVEDLFTIFRISERDASQAKSHPFAAHFLLPKRMVIKYIYKQGSNPLVKKGGRYEMNF